LLQEPADSARQTNQYRVETHRRTAGHWAEYGELLRKHQSDKIQIVATPNERETVSQLNKALKKAAETN
jgi:hypothetical protein